MREKFWVRWCVAFRYNEPLDLHWIVLSLSISAKVALIDSAADLAELMERYPVVVRGRRGLDFERLAEDYDALHLTHEGYLRTRSPRRGPRLVGWDCESTLWFRWMFTEWRDVQPCFVDADVFDDLWLTLSGWSADDYRCHRMPENRARKKSMNVCCVRRVVDVSRVGPNGMFAIRNLNGRPYLAI